MTTKRTTTSHDSCTHEKTKAARAACRKAGTDRPPVEPKAKPTTDDGPRVDPYAEDTRVFERGGNVCGPCGNGHHDRCPVGGKQWYCTCNEAAHTL